MTDYEVGILWALSWDKPEVRALIRKLVEERDELLSVTCDGTGGCQHRDEAIMSFGIPSEQFND
jgi:hypothetical protein